MLHQYLKLLNVILNVLLKIQPPNWQPNYFINPHDKSNSSGNAAAIRNNSSDLFKTEIGLNLGKDRFISYIRVRPFSIGKGQQ